MHETAAGLNPRQEHWELVYSTKSDSELSWFEPEPCASLDLIREASPTPCRVADIGGGSSTLVDHLLADGFTDITVLDISQSAITRAKDRLGAKASLVNWVVADIVQVKAIDQLDIWHDRAAFHFLTSPEDHRNYLDLARRTIRTGGHLIIGAFGLDGPQQCSNLDVRRYDAATLRRELGPYFRFVRERMYYHSTPSGKKQQFYFADFELLPTAEKESGSTSSVHKS